MRACNWRVETEELGLSTWELMVVTAGTGTLWLHVVTKWLQLNASDWKRGLATEGLGLYSCYLKVATGG